MSDDLVKRARDDAFLSRMTDAAHEVPRAELMEALADELDRLRAENERLMALVDRANHLISGDLVGGEWKRASRGFCRDARAALKTDGGKE